MEIRTIRLILIILVFIVLFLELIKVIKVTLITSSIIVGIFIISLIISKWDKDKQGGLKNE